MFSSNFREELLTSKKFLGKINSKVGILFTHGLRRLEETCGAAYLGTLETALPFMAANSQICKQMEDDWGGEDCWGHGDGIGAGR